MKWEDIDIHLLIWFGICAAASIILYCILSTIFQIKEHKKYMKFIEIKQKERIEYVKELREEKKQ